MRIKQTVAAFGGLLALAMAGAAWAGVVEFEFDAGDFNDSTTLDNDFWGLRMSSPSSAVFFSESDDGCEVSEATVVDTTGTGFFDAPYDVDAVVIQDREWVSEECDGDYQLVEDTFDWYAQDDGGNVWYLGEDTTALEELEGGGYCLSSAGSWKAGDDVAGIGIVAEPGVIMPADPQPGDAYQQEYYEGEAEDWAKVLRLNATVSIEYDDGEFFGCLQTKEYTPLAPGEVEHKYYCRLSQGGVGLTLINELKERTKRVEYVGTGKPTGSYGTFPANTPACPD